MRVVIFSYSSVLLCFLCLDAIWLGFLARDFYSSALGPMLKQQIDIWPAVLFYVFYAAAIVFFALGGAGDRFPMRKAALRGALLGLTAYGAYDLTNLATLRDWPLAMSLVDMAWGMTVTGFSAAAGAWTLTIGRGAK